MTSHHGHYYCMSCDNFVARKETLLNHLRHCCSQKRSRTNKKNIDRSHPNKNSGPRQCSHKSTIKRQDTDTPDKQTEQEPCYSPKNEV